MKPADGVGYLQQLGIAGPSRREPSLANLSCGGGEQSRLQCKNRPLSPGGGLEQLDHDPIGLRVPERVGDDWADVVPLRDLLGRHLLKGGESATESRCGLLVCAHEARCQPPEERIDGRFSAFALKRDQCDLPDFATRGALSALIRRQQGAQRRQEGTAAELGIERSEGFGRLQEESGGAPPLAQRETDHPIE